MLFLHITLPLAFVLIAIGACIILWTSVRDAVDRFESLRFELETMNRRGTAGRYMGSDRHGFTAIAL